MASTAHKPRTIPLDTPVIELDEEISTTLTYVRAYPDLAPLIAQLETIQQDWMTLFQQERALERAVLAAEVGIIVVDDDLDDVAVKLSSTILSEVGEKQRKDPRYQRYYKEPPSRLRRPVLGPQLATMTEWVPSLTDASASAPVQAHGQRLATLVLRAENAVKALSSAEAAVTDFNTIGAKKAFIDRLNGLRMTAFGQIAELPHTRPELNLPADFAQRFFLRDTADKKPTIASVEQAILRARARVAELEALLARLLEDAEAEAQLAEEAEVREAMKVLEKAEKEKAAAEQKIEAARARLAAKKKNEQ